MDDLQQYFFSDVSNIKKSQTKKEERPEFVLASLMSTYNGIDAEVISIKYGEKGYHYSTYGRQTEEWVIVKNEQAGIDAETALTFRVCSITGKWDEYEQVLNKFKGKVSDVSAD